MNIATLRDGMVFENAGVNRAQRGRREIVIASIYPGPGVAIVRDLRTDKGFRLSLATLCNSGRWSYTGTDAWKTA